MSVIGDKIIDVKGIGFWFCTAGSVLGRYTDLIGHCRTLALTWSEMENHRGLEPKKRHNDDTHLKNHWPLQNVVREGWEWAGRCCDGLGGAYRAWTRTRTRMGEMRISSQILGILSSLKDLLVDWI